ncbi:hypothetical protein K493DRAFT_346906 [Basidiobolus meristosporus CBS 931.73]|uniref:Uncharacterized protein n=1 Tax=Basidiobolus meristosporus CBS 931.73 TaxID=1314790 RepID=A0A1Y1YVV7_9FUNG|nr:hypothetical protein K493DRAFT_346906 [Basidiobolus meristosporus CBS 931.73]|eukprot:ORY02089.1 hypothetical protein K493DRAFT_346906 [Basidiobolus meristosporus CBS 931.73]
MPASASAAPAIYPHQEKHSITEYKLEKAPFESPITVSHSHLPSTSDFNSTKSVSLPSLMNDNRFPSLNSVGCGISTDHSIRPMRENIDSDCTKLDTLAAAAESQDEAAATRKDTTPGAENLADLAAAAISSLSDLATGRVEAPVSNQTENRRYQTESHTYKKTGFMSISALLDETSNRPNESPPPAPWPSYPSNENIGGRAKELSEDVTSEALARPSKRPLNESEPPSKKKYTPMFDPSATSRSNNINDGYTSTPSIDGKVDGAYPGRSRYSEPYHLSDVTSTRSTPIPQYKPGAYGSESTHPGNTAPAGYRNFQPSYQPLRVEGPNTFSKKFQSMQDPKIKRNATHAYIAYMIYTDRLQNKLTNTILTNINAHMPISTRTPINTSILTIITTPTTHIARLPQLHPNPHIQMQESSGGPYYSSSERPASGAPHSHFSGPTVSSRPVSAATTTGYSPESVYGSSHHRDSPSAYVSGSYTAASAPPQPAYSPNMRPSQPARNYGYQSSQMPPRGSSEHRYYDVDRAPTLILEVLPRKDTSYQARRSSRPPILCRTLCEECRAIAQDRVAAVGEWTGRTEALQGQKISSEEYGNHVEGKEPGLT